MAPEVLGPDLLAGSMAACPPSHSLTHSPTLQFRAESIVPERMKEMTRCIQEHDFQGFAQLTMKDSNQFHATCLDTFPPISYLNDTSRRIIQLVHRFNAHHGQTKVSGRGGGCRPTEGWLQGTWVNQCEERGQTTGAVVHADRQRLRRGCGWPPGWGLKTMLTQHRQAHSTDRQAPPTVLVCSVFFVSCLICSLEACSWAPGKGDSHQGI